LITKGQEQAARDGKLNFTLVPFSLCILIKIRLFSALKKLRNSQDIEDDILEMRAEEQAQMAEAKITLFELVTSPTLKLPLLIAIVMQLSQQLSGINAVRTYCLVFDHCKRNTQKCNLHFKFHGNKTIDSN
jgi:hypothetical protein